MNFHKCFHSYIGENYSYTKLKLFLKYILNVNKYHDALQECSVLKLMLNFDVYKNVSCDDAFIKKYATNFMLNLDVKKKRYT